MFRGDSGSSDSFAGVYSSASLNIDYKLNVRDKTKDDKMNQMVLSAPPLRNMSPFKLHVFLAIPSFSFFFFFFNG